MRSTIAFAASLALVAGVVFFAVNARPRVRAAVQLAPYDGQLSARGRTLADLASFFETEGLVAYGYAPAAHLEPVPGSLPRLKRLVTAWVEAGAGCPVE